MIIKDKVIIVTGASKGIGFALVKQLHELGAKVVMASRDIETLHDIERDYVGTYAIKTDMRKPGEIRNMIAMTVEKYDRVDILINNAGQGLYSAVETIDLEKYKEIMELNVYGVLIAMQSVIPIMRTQRAGMILNVSSRVSKNYFPGLAAYASTKYALNAISLTARAELEKDGIVVSVFHPKMTATEFPKNAIRSNPNAPRPNAVAADTADAVAEHIVDQIESEDAEAAM